MVQGKYEIRTATTVIAIRPGGEVGIAFDRILQTLRHPRLVSGLRARCSSLSICVTSSPACIQ